MDPQSIENYDMYDLFNIEYSFANIQDTYYKVLDYCNPMYVNIHNKPSYANFSMLYMIILIWNNHLRL